ncbi:MAG: hypothetical protein IKP86_04930 [Anaerolineaceae bacterium]|nr:hypothetical protein [Anaerolineaceae bacterium]
MIAKKQVSDIRELRRVITSESGDDLAELVFHENSAEISCQGGKILVSDTDKMYEFHKDGVLIARSEASKEEKILSEKWTSAEKVNDLTVFCELNPFETILLLTYHDLRLSHIIRKLSSGKKTEEKMQG